jgi:hypothetical protein
MLGMRLVEVKAKDREDLLNALMLLGETDADFIGENGLEYLWDEVWKANGYEDRKDYENQMENFDAEDDEAEEPELKYESNADWLCDYVKDIKDEVECVETFINTWMEMDSGYYTEYEFDYITDSNGNIVALAFATNT